jgi:hypothetical protein
VAAGDYSQQLLVFKGIINDCPARILVDSGANGMFISSDYVNRNDLITSSLAHAMRIRMANGAVQTTNLQVSDVDVRVQSYRDTLSFTVTPIKGYDAIFGKPWLTAHNPVIDWSSNTITFPFHLVGDLAPQPEVRLQIVKAKKMLKDIRNGTSTIFMATIQELQATMATVESQSRSEPESTDVDPFRPENTCLSPANVEALHSILDTYRESFSKPTSVPTTGPLHKIDLKPGSQPTHQHLRRMSPAELAEVQRQLEEYLSNGWIRPSTSE